MRHERSILLLTGWWILVLAGGGWAQTASVSDALRQEMILDNARKTAAPAVPAADPYAREGAQMASQLQVISDNEDINYTIIEGDTLTVMFKDRDQVNKAAYKVSSTGEIHMPLLGPVKVAGLNRKQARERIDMMLRDYFRAPQASIAINTDGRVMIFGAVLGPGLYNLSNKMSVMEAIFTAGGFIKQTAELASVIVIRGPVEKPLILKLNLKKMITRGDRSEDVAVKPGDFIYVPTTFISNLDAFWNAAQNLVVKWYSLGGGQPLTSDGTLLWGKGQ